MNIDIDALLSAPTSPAVAKDLVEWANNTRGMIESGGLMIGSVAPEDVAKIPLAYRKAAEQGETVSWLALAWWYAMPSFGDPDIPEAELALQEAIKAGVVGAELELVKIRWFFKRETATQDEQHDTFECVSRLVASGPDDGEAAYFLALLVTHGFGTPASPEKGFKLQQKAADLGNTDAMFEVVVHYSQGLGVTADEEAALEACQRAAEAGHSRAMYNMGAFNASGRGMPKNIPEAIKWYERAADQGNPMAMAGLALIYGEGDGIEKDLEYAEEMLDQADYCGLDVSDLREQLGLPE